MKRCTLTISFDRCKACLLCIDACKKNCIGQGTALNPAGYIPVVFDENGGCNGCALCAVRCPDVAIEIFENE